MAGDPPDVDAVTVALRTHGYLPDEGLATAIFLAMTMRRPLLLEGEAGVGKTEVAKAISAWTGGPLIRLQCYEGIDATQAVYDWDYARQLLHLRATEVTGAERDRLYDQHAEERPEFKDYPIQTTRVIPVFTLERIG